MALRGLPKILLQACYRVMSLHHRCRTIPVPRPPRKTPWPHTPNASDNGKPVHSSIRENVKGPIFPFITRGCHVEGA